MNPSVRSLVLSAVDWEELCPWLLFRKCLGLSFSIRLLSLTTLLLLVCSLWLATAFGFFSSGHSTEDFLRSAPFVDAQRSFLTKENNLEDSVRSLQREDPLPSPLCNGESSELSPLQKTLNDCTSEVPGMMPASETISETGIAKTAPPKEPSEAKRSTTKNEQNSSNWTFPGIMNAVAAVLFTFFVMLFFWLTVVRLTAMRVSRGLNGQIRTEIKLALHHIPSVFGAFLMILLGVVLLGLPLWFCRFLPSALLVWVSPFALLYTVFYFFLLLGSGVGVFFVPSVLMTENSDVFDALSRSFAYALQKPLRFAFYIVVALCFGVLGLTGIMLIVGLTTQLFVALANIPMTPQENCRLVLLAFAWSIAAFLLLYTISTVQGLYLLLRRDVDAVELEVLWLPNPQGVPVPSLPELTQVSQ